MTRRNKDYERKGMTFDPATSRTKQATVPTNINDIMAKYHRESDLVPVSQALGIYGDFSEIGDFQSALEQVTKAQEAFLQLPSVVRKMCENSPQQFMDWIADPANHDQAVRLKLMDGPAEPPRAFVTKVINEPDPDPKAGE